ncbi:MAG: 7-cyano-7-deazaguanine synthase [Ginsengibacter sp.]
MNKAILLSGGMDSISLAYWKKPSIAITIDYGQAPAQTEIRSSKIVADVLGIEHHVIKVDCRELGSGDLINETAIEEISPSTEWWPYRNQLLVTLASMKAISLSINELMVASVKTDGFHKDGTDKFYEKINALVEYQEGNIKVMAPCIKYSTVELIKLSGVPKDILLWAHSCHKSNIACGNCRGCNKYAQVLNELCDV